MNRKKLLGEMSFYGVAVALAMLILFSPLYSYVQAKQRISNIEYSISRSMGKYATALSINEYDDLKYTYETNSDIYNKITDPSSSYYNMGIPTQILQQLGFTAESANKWNGPGGTTVTDFSMRSEKIGGTMYYYMDYTLTVPLKFYGVTAKDYVTKNTAVATYTLIS
ncbi:MAG: hypothetical protein ACI4DY_01345 [Monoglobaceae bacterium]